MVEDGHADGDWLNGRTPMPHAADPRALGGLNTVGTSAEVRDSSKRRCHSCHHTRRSCLCLLMALTSDLACENILGPQLTVHGSNICLHRILMIVTLFSKCSIRPTPHK